MNLEGASAVQVGDGKKLGWYAALAGAVAIAAMGGGYFFGRSLAAPAPAPASRDDAPAILRELAQQRTSIDQLSHQLSARSVERVEAPAETDPRQIKTAVRAALDERDQEAATEKEQAEATQSAENQADYTRAAQSVEAALATGKWTRENMSGLHVATQHLTQAQFMELNGRVIRAFNEGKLELVR
jgi:hypothetical protein